jgi:hypothetical protein
MQHENCGDADNGHEQQRDNPATMATVKALPKTKAI